MWTPCPARAFAVPPAPSNSNYRVKNIGRRAVMKPA